MGCTGTASAIAGVLMLLAGVPADAEIVLDAPASIPAGAQLSIGWSGDGEPRDFITVVPPDTPEGKYADYQYARQQTVELRAPEDAGRYEIRYLDASPPYATRARRALEVTPVSATLTVPEAVDAGAAIPIAWTGPDNQRDFIAIVQAGSPQRKWLSYVYTSKGSPLALRAPDEPGDYEIRYLTGQSYYTLASAPLLVRGTGASLQAPAAVQAGEAFEVAWTGPANTQDFIAIAADGADVRGYLSYQYAARGSPVTLRAPDEPGTYEVRYQTGQSYAVLASRKLAVNAVTATLQAPAEVKGGTTFEVAWTGPDHAGDYIRVTRLGEDDGAASSKWVYTRHGSPAALIAPLAPGDYELRYQTGQSGRVLASRPVRITPPDVQPGVLRVAAWQGGNGAFGGGDAVELILDASGSMLQRQGDKRRIEIAREVLLGLTGDTIPAGTPFALRIFGHKEADSCRTDLEVPLGPLDVAAVDAKIRSVQAMNLAKTPIARSLELVAQDLKGIAGERVVVLITDGEETCDGDPAAAIESLRAAGMDVRIDIVGFAIDDERLKASFRYWADLGGGAYYDAANAEDLGRSVTRALQAPFEVLNGAGEIVAAGVAGDAGVTLPAGDYTVRLRTMPQVQSRVTVLAGSHTGVTLEAGNE